jgi:hypothetical protein
MGLLAVLDDTQRHLSYWVPLFDDERSRSQIDSSFVFYLWFLYRITVSNLPPLAMAQLSISMASPNIFHGFICQPFSLSA